ncbi:hypothetical protein BASA50_002771 [Batrachochytrium salamandrivorans]|uniref:Minichromosome loss protein Mcl1 middle region domain-containing protein n=1 Tax=Batrachochytrium salamandrivorans TaxID=1357716 RepID=A0ABQ8FK97_9FUNG|nr:hypothetical protein BASA50_002771 [Batrachochytrium salamandrivorans]
MLERLASVNAGHSCAVFSSDGSKIITAGLNNLLKVYSTNLVRTGNTSTAPLKVEEIHEQSITALAIHGSMLVAACESHHVRLFDLESLSIKTLLYRSILKVTNLSFSPDGKWIAIGTEEGDVRLVNIKEPTRTIALEGHSNSIKFIAFHPKEDVLVTSSIDGTLRIWKLAFRKLTESNDTAKVSSDLADVNNLDSAVPIKVLRDLISRPTPGITEFSYIAWHPSGDHFAACGRRQEVVTVQNGTWNIMYRLVNPDAASILQYSPNGMYLLCIGVKGHVRIWRPQVDREIPIINEKHAGPITGSFWHPRSNELLLMDASGNLGYIEKAIPPELPHPVTGQEKKIIKQAPKSSSEQSNSKLDQLFADLEAAEDEPISSKRGLVRKDMTSARKTSAETSNSMDKRMGNGADDSDEEIDEEEYEDMCDFVVDDDGAGYLEDLKRPSDERRYQERSRAKAFSELQRGTGLSRSNKSLFESSSTNEIQSSFQSGSTPERNNRRYLAFNLVGVISSLKNDIHWTVNVEYHDKSQRPFHFTDHYGYSMGALNESGAVFSCEATSSTPSTIFFRPTDNWPTKDEWTVQLTAGESVLSIALTKMGIVVATDMNFLRFFSYGGLQTSVQSLSGPTLTMVGNGANLLIVYHSSGVFHGNQCLSFILMDLEKRSTVYSGRLPISPSSTLEWVGFSDTMIPVSYDSKGILRGMFLHNDAAWVPLLDANVVRGTKQDHYWALGLVGNQFMCVVCKTGKVPDFPKPIINEIPLKIPFAQPDLPSAQLEESLFQKKMFLGHQMAQNPTNMDDYSDDEGEGNDAYLHDKLALDKIVLKLIHAACLSERVQRALDLCTLLHSMKSLDGAIKLAVHLHLPSLAARVNSLKEARYLAEKQRKAASERRRLNYRPIECIDMRDSEQMQFSRDLEGGADHGLIDPLSSQQIERDSRTTTQFLRAPEANGQVDHPVVLPTRSIETDDILNGQHASANVNEATHVKTPAIHLKKSRNPFSMTALPTAPVPDAAEGKLPLPDTINGLKLFQVISNSTALKEQQDASKIKKPLIDHTSSKRKQTTLFGVTLKSVGDNVDHSEGKAKKPRGDMDGPPVAMASGSAISKQVTPDQFLVKANVDADGSNSPQATDVSGESTVQSAMTTDLIPEVLSFKDTHVKGGGLNDKENVENVVKEVPAPRRLDKGKDPADISKSLQGFIFQK